MTTTNTTCTTTTTAPRIAEPDNGYFVTYARPCGHTFRIVTEYDQYTLRHGTPDRKKAVKGQIKAKAAERAAAPCPHCQEA